MKREGRVDTAPNEFLSFFVAKIFHPLLRLEYTYTYEEKVSRTCVAGRRDDDKSIESRSSACENHSRREFIKKRFERIINFSQLIERRVRDIRVKPLILIKILSKVYDETAKSIRILM